MGVFVIYLQCYELGIRVVYRPKIKIKSLSTSDFHFPSLSGRTLLHIQERLKVEHSLQDVLFKAALKGGPPVHPEK